jgi:hypothetical protein
MIFIVKEHWWQILFNYTGLGNNHFHYPDTVDLHRI